MRRPLLAAIVALLAVSSVLEAVAYAEQANACWFMRLPQAERPPCCDLMGKTRFTLPGGDCCKFFVYDEGDARALSDVPTDVPPAGVVVFARTTVANAPTRISSTTARARAPPPRWRPTDTVRLLI
ncbi:MAG: hypothetical protein AAGE52_34800 [Myxococcota bacterium]